MKPTKAEEKIIAQRWEKKKANLETLANAVTRLRLNVSNDLKSEKEKDFLTALVIAIMDKTGERVGNSDSAGKGHHGVTGFLKKHIKIDGNEVTLTYTGKSGVDHDKCFTDERIANALKKAIENSPDKKVFVTSAGFHILADRVNRYLADFSITAKDIRGYNANSWIIEKLKTIDISEKENERKRQFNKIVKSVAEKIGHGAGTLKKHYMIPELPQHFIATGEIVELKELGYYKDGGKVEGDFENSKKSNNFIPKITKDEIQYLISGNGQVGSGEAIKAITRYLTGSAGADSMAEEKQPDKKQQEAALKKYSSENNLWVNYIINLPYLSAGAEQKVYLQDENVVKLNDAIFYASWIDYFNSLLLHNFFFPSTAYEFIGFTEQNNVLYSIVKQRYIKATSPTDLSAVKIFLAENGFKNTKANDYYNPELGLILEDLHDENVLTDGNTLCFIDTVFYMQSKKHRKFHDGGNVIEKHKLLAPNGKPSNLTPEQYKLVRTPAFKKWFGDWENAPKTASKVVDENGEPLVVYHGTNDRFNIFLKSKALDKEGRSIGIGQGKNKFYFTPDFKTALGNGKNMISAFVRLINPLPINMYDDMVYREYSQTGENYSKVKRDKVIHELDKYLKEEGYDGLFQNGATVAFKPNQIKLADGSNTTFDAKNPDIRYEMGGLFHGSPHSFDKFTTDKMGTGEGIQSVGWGLYFTDVKDIAKRYALTPNASSLYINGKPLTDSNFTAEQKELILSIWAEIHRDGYYATKDEIIAEIIYQLKNTSQPVDNEAMAGAFDDAELAEMNKLAATNKAVYDVLANADIDIKATIYNLKLHKGKNPDQYDWLIWDKPVPANQIKKIREKVFPSRMEIDKKEENWFNAHLKSGSMIYDWLRHRAAKGYHYVPAWADKEASLFLLSIGIDGIKYPVNYLSTGEPSDSAKEFNYVVFDENAVSIEGKEKFKQGGITAQKTKQLLAPNGKPSNLTPQQYKLVRTAAFKKWFGDWENAPETASKVVDENGEPMVVYRGSPENQKKIGYVFETGNNFLKKENRNNFGFFFTPDIGIAKSYMDGRVEGSVLSVFLNAKNIIDLSQLGFKSIGTDFIKNLEIKNISFSGYERLKLDIAAYERTYDRIDLKQWYTPNIYDFFDKFPKLNDVFASNNIDGLIFKEKSRSYLGELTYVVFYSTQIKLADGSNTTFNSESADIRYKKGGKVEYELNSKGGYDYEGAAEVKAKKAQIITLPKNIKGTNCGNCVFRRNAFCDHKEVTLPVTDRMCCAHWDDKSVRSYVQNLFNADFAAYSIEIPATLNKHGGFDYSGKELKKAKAADLITLPPDVEGTNCANCKFWDKGFCNHPEIMLPVTARMSCGWWDSSKAIRQWNGATEIMFAEKGGIVPFSENEQEIISKLENANTLKELKDIADNNFIKIGSGTGRFVYRFSDKYVIKIAKNQKGIQQNKTESNADIAKNYGDIVARVVQHGNGYRWEIQEFAEPISEDEFGLLMPEYQFAGFAYYLRGFGGLNDYYDNLSFAKKIKKLISVFRLEHFDLANINSWGRIHNQPILVDYGLTLDTARKLYGIKYANGGDINTVSIPEQATQRFVYENNGVFDYEKAKEFLKKWFNINIVKPVVGDGSNGVVYRTDEGKAIKFTASKKEAEFNQKLIGKPNDFTPDIYAVRHLAGTDTYMIVREFIKEALSQDDYGYLWETMDDILNAGDLNNRSFDEILQGIKFLREDERKVLKEYYARFVEMKKWFDENNFQANDFNKYNMGIKNGKIVCFDCQYEKGGEIETQYVKSIPLSVYNDILNTLSTQIINQDRLVIFGSLSSKKITKIDDEIKGIGDIDCCYMLPEYTELRGIEKSMLQDCRTLIQLAKKHYGYFDNFIYLKYDLLVRDEYAQSYTFSMNRKKMRKEINAGIKYTDLIKKPAVDKSKNKINLKKWSKLNAHIATKVQMVPIEVVQKYREFDRRANPIKGEHYLDELKEKIKKEGIIAPLTFTYGVEDFKLSLGEGNHRLNIAEELGYTEVPAYVKLYRKNAKGKTVYPTRRLAYDTIYDSQGRVEQGKEFEIKPSDLGLVAEKMAKGGIINKEVSASATAAINDVIKVKYTDLKELYAGFLYRMVKQRLETLGVTELTPETEELFYDDFKVYPTDFEKAIIKSLSELKYIMLFDFSQYQYKNVITEFDISFYSKAYDFYQAVNHRKETRIGVRYGYDMFPDEALLGEGLKTVSDAAIKPLKEKAAFKSSDKIKFKELPEEILEKQLEHFSKTNKEFILLQKKADKYFREKQIKEQKRLQLFKSGESMTGETISKLNKEIEHLSEQVNEASDESMLLLKEKQKELSSSVTSKKFNAAPFVLEAEQVVGFYKEFAETPAEKKAFLQELKDIITMVEMDDSKTAAAMQKKYAKLLA